MTQPLGPAGQRLEAGGSDCKSVVEPVGLRQRLFAPLAFGRARVSHGDLRRPEEMK
jgi:hypothetical protein